MKSIYLSVIVQSVMRTMAVLVILSWGGMKTVAQEWDHEYIPFVEEGKVWNCNNTDDADAGVIDFVFTLRSDTLIGDNIYKKVLCQYEKYYGDDKQHYYCAVRENEYRVYLVETETTDEKLIYDFSRPNDKLMLSYDGQEFVRMPGSHVDIAFWPSKQLCFPLYDTSGKAIDISWGWMEGVGIPFGNPFAGGLNINKTDPLFGFIIVVTCIKDRECLYDFDWLVQPTIIQETEKSVPIGSIYDLSGRRVQGTPKKGVYIQNGKKVVIK